MFRYEVNEVSSIWGGERKDLTSIGMIRPHMDLQIGRLLERSVTIETGVNDLLAHGRRGSVDPRGPSPHMDPHVVY